ncbi:Tfp pilus assembly protein FimT/FimU [Nostoc sp. FACHB-280]|uniref:pilus assembly FimT family protein n=1 Tax=Nostoc sp. FACHB-280 TaxID=2692839 RepID=UPI00168BA5F7|nr:type II secretion system protein [Nostoc sp. FACHB-280]MBD2497619.1 type II secretion system protein [Nostoc sp. FACHB-280]
MKGRFFERSQYFVAQYNCQTNAGFSLVEMVAVVLIVGILAAIAIPRWNTFLNRQRVGKANDAVLTALREVQQQAKTKKLKYSVSFRNNNNLPELALHADSDTPSSSQWKTLGEDLRLKAGQVWIGTNLTSKNQGSSTVSVITNNVTTTKTITFDYNGTLPIDATTPLKIVVAAPSASNITQPGSVKRCVIIQTLLGGIRTGRDNECN